MKRKHAPIWCVHCNTEIKVTAVRSCLRKTCEAKALLPDAKGVKK